MPLEPAVYVRVVMAGLEPAIQCGTAEDWMVGSSGHDEQEDERPTDYAVYLALVASIGPFG